MKTLRKVDNVGKMFLSTCNGQAANVFRLSCELKSPINADCLSEALRKTIECFPYFQVVIKKSLLWYYFEQSELIPLVISGAISPCVPIYQKGCKTLLYRVSCLDNQIHLDMFHALSDGAGAACFLRLLIGAYLIEAHEEAFGQAKPTDYFTVQPELHELDGFETHYGKPTARKYRIPPRSFQIQSGSLPDNQINVFQGILPTQDVLGECRSRDISLTELLTAVYIDAIHKTMTAKDERRPVAISIPVNLRKYFRSESAGNFFALINARYDFSQNPGDLNTILGHIHRDFDEQLQTDRLRDNFSRFVSYERNAVLRVTPLAFKNPALRFSGWVSKRFNTSSLSNLGQIQMPPVFAPYIIRFNCFNSTDSMRMGVVSFGNELCIKIISAVSDDSIPLAFFSILSMMGLSASITQERFN